MIHFLQKQRHGRSGRKRLCVCSWFCLPSPSVTRSDPPSTAAVCKRAVRRWNIPLMSPASTKALAALCGLELDLTTPPARPARHQHHQQHPRRNDKLDHPLACTLFPLCAAPRIHVRTIASAHAPFTSLNTQQLDIPFSPLPRMANHCLLPTQLVHWSPNSPPSSPSSVRSPLYIFYYVERSLLPLHHFIKGYLLNHEGLKIIDKFPKQCWRAHVLVCPEPSLDRIRVAAVDHGQPTTTLTAS